jgi:hypothetical protein
MPDDSSSFMKWLGGIIAAIITGLVLWWLTGPQSPFIQHKENKFGNAQQIGEKSEDKVPTAPGKSGDLTGNLGNLDEEKKPNVLLTRFDFANPIKIGETTAGDFEVSNKGNAAATGCQITWELPGLNGTKISDKFDLQPGEVKGIQLVSNSIGEKGTISTNARLSCSNNSDVVETKQLVVYMMMNRNNISSP